MIAALERDLIGRLTADMPRSSRQLNAAHESDAELVDLRYLGTTLAISTDGVEEEIATGLYGDPYLAGWMTVVVNASDLAAVAAAPLGIVVCESLPAEMPPDALRALQRGIADAARAHDLPVLGGDTNVSDRLHLSATAIGTVTGTPLTRRGATDGDALFVSGPLGLGSAFAAAAFLGVDLDVAFRPRARTREGQLLARYASSCIDTSDGFITACDELMRVNDIGLHCTARLETALHPTAIEAARLLGLPRWTMLAGPHGEFELLFTVPRDRKAAFVRSAGRIAWRPVEVGTVRGALGLGWDDGEISITIDTTEVRNLFVQAEGDPHVYVRGLLRAVA